MSGSARLKSRLCRGLYALSLGLGILTLNAGAFSGVAQAREPASSCTDHAIEAERRFDLPSGLLLSMALVESGMGGAPYPYAINHNGRSIMASSLQEARGLLRDGGGRPRNGLFVGCMQLAVSFHKQHFKPLEAILDPRNNVFYAAKYLKRLRAETGSWTKAVERYQGGTRAQRRAYVCKVHNRLSALHSESAVLLDAVHCGPAEPPSIAPETRRKFDQRQVAQLNLH